MTARLLIGDVFDRMAELEAGSYDVIVTSPPFLALRSYLPDGHPDKAKEIGSEATPAAFLDVMLALTAEWGRLLAPHGSIAIEIGDTYSGSGGAGGDYNENGLREGQQAFSGSAAKRRANGVGDDYRPARSGRDVDAWPLTKSLAMIPELYAASLAYGRNLLRAPMTAREMLNYAEGWTHDHPDASATDLLGMLAYWLGRYETDGPVIQYERWRVRNFKPWIRSNPPVGSLGDKERPATSYITVATRAVDRYFDLDAVRTRPSQDPATYTGNGYTKGRPEGVPGNESMAGNAAGAPPLDWVHTVDLIIDDEIDTRAGRRNGGGRRGGKPLTEYGRRRLDAANSGGVGDGNHYSDGAETVGARGVHIRRRLETAGILTTLDALDVSPKGYASAHYAVWPPELVKRLLQEMCPRRVCTTCGTPSRRITGEAEYHRTDSDRVPARLAMTDGARLAEGVNQHHQHNGANTSVTAHRPTVGWSHCGCGNGCEPTTWRKVRTPVIDENTGEPVLTKAGKPKMRTARVVDQPGNCADPYHWRPGRILDPFAGSGTTLAVATGLGHHADGIDLDPRNADLARERCGMFLDIDHGPSPGRDTVTLTLTGEELSP